MLTVEEYQFGVADNSSERIVALFQLRNNVTSFIIQCLADREIQKEFYKSDKASPAYHYNCAVIHQPHRASKVHIIFLYSWYSIANNSKIYIILNSYWQ